MKQFIYKANSEIYLQNEFNSIPGDKSISHRAIICGALANNTSYFTNFLFSEDCLNTIAIFQSLGVHIDIDSSHLVTVKGVGLHGLKEAHKALDVGNSGTGIRLITGVLAGQSFNSTISGDNSIQTRPMKRIIDPLSQMDAKISGNQSKKGDITPPLTITGQPSLHATTYTLPIASAQVKSAILFASLYSQDSTTVIEPELCRNHTEKMLHGFGADITVSGKEIRCSGKNELKNPYNDAIFIPSDISSAAFFIVLGCIIKGARFMIKGIGLNETRATIIDVLKMMGADITIHNIKGQDVEPYGDIEVRYSQLHNIHIPEETIPFLIDEIPILAIASMFAKGRFKVSNAKELRVKESDRIETTGALLHAMGGKFRAYDDGFECEAPDELTSFEARSFGDHRIAMSGIIGAIGANVDATIHNCDCINTSFPNFFEILKELNINNENTPLT